MTPNGRGVHTIAGGTVRGSNLFHSFERFDVGTRETARFTGPNAIDNIFSRVTGGHPSTIDGLIQSRIPGAHLYLLNPSGVVFGPNASLDVKGSFHVSTAEVLHFADGYALRAVNQPEPLLTVAPPTAFGFLREQPAAIRIQESVLAVPEGETLSVVGGDIEITGGPRGFLAAPSGQIALVSVASPGKVVPHDPGELQPFTVAAFERLGTITISDLALLDTRGEGGGAVVIRGGQVTIEGSSAVVADTLGDRDGVAIGIDIRAGHIHITEATLISSTTLGRGRGGSITISATESVQLTGTGADSVPSAILAQALGRREGVGAAGTIVVDAPIVTLTDGGRISSTTLGPGQGGSITVTAANAISLAGQESGLFTNAAGSGPGGDIAVVAPSIRLSGDATISAQSSGTGNAGTIHLRATDTFLSENSAVTTAAETASGGNIALEAQLIRLTDSALTAEARGREQRGSDGGNITIQAEFVILDHSQVQANAFGGNGGDIVITAEGLLADTETCANQACLNASSELGLPGTVEINTPTADLSGVVTPLPQSFTQATALLPQRCAERLQGQPVSTFVLAGRDSLPAQPGGMLPSPLVAEGSERTQQGPDKTRGHGVPGVHHGQLGVDTHGRPRVQGWPVHGMASLVLDAACPQGHREQEATRTHSR